jgi:hypothetical protein
MKIENNRKSGRKWKKTKKNIKDQKPLEITNQKNSSKKEKNATGLAHAIKRADGDY